jgi:hypothetical protein
MCAMKRPWRPGTGFWNFSPTPLAIGIIMVGEKSFTAWAGDSGGALGTFATVEAAAAAIRRAHADHQEKLGAERNAP